MFWTSLFSVGIAQGLFLISLIAFKKSKNFIASVIIVTLLGIMVLTNAGYLVVTSSLIDYIPNLFAVPFGMMFLFGPLLYFYSRSILDSTFVWKKKYWFHFIPYFIQLTLNLPLIFAPATLLQPFLASYLSGDLQVRLVEKIVFALQDIHLLLYLALTFRWLQTVKTSIGNAQYIISVSARTKWINELAYCFSVFLVSVFGLYIFVLITGKYNPVANYAYTLITSCIIYFIAYKMLLKQELIVLDFTKKYKAYKPFDNAEGEDYVQKLKTLLGEKKIFTNAELKLGTIAAELGLPQYQVSKLINEKFGKSFNDLINEYRVQEFIERINKPEFRSYSILGVALDVGFNTKSSFNSAFKKITGKTPSDFRKTE